MLEPKEPWAVLGLAVLGLAVLGLAAAASLTYLVCAEKVLCKISRQQPSTALELSSALRSAPQTTSHTEMYESASQTGHRKDKKVLSLAFSCPSHLLPPAGCALAPATCSTRGNSWGLGCKP